MLPCGFCAHRGFYLCSVGSVIVDQFRERPSTGKCDYHVFRGPTFRDGGASDRGCHQYHRARVGAGPMEGNDRIRLVVGRRNCERADSPMDHRGGSGERFDVFVSTGGPLRQHESEVGRLRP